MVPRPITPMVEKVRFCAAEVVMPRMVARGHPM
jgi:hypothetical protein